MFRIFWLVFILLGCARVNTLNGNPHDFGKHPKQVVWLQIAGFTEEHLAMLRFGRDNSSEKTAFESASCAGKMWSYNLFNLRPTSHQSFMAQILGKKNISGNCGDSKRRPLWSYLEEAGYQIGLFESGASKEDSMEKVFSCKEASSFKKNVITWLMRNAENQRDIFHYQEERNFKPGIIYYDKSCIKGNVCYSGLFNNVHSIYSQFYQESVPSFFLLRDFSYQKALKSKNVKQARLILNELNKLINYFNSELKEKDALFLITSAAPQGIEFPLQGKQWAQFENNGKNLIYRNPGLMASVLASGAGAEHFCGIFEESEIFIRLLWSFKNSKFNL
ncbi:MAG: hypothetical protein OXB84_08275 [Halobacteriovoraceae bacterium]|nr:hypothetical protein [Halobacteriovoraceae bacterium]